jgi:hypothetical protein
VVWVDDASSAALVGRRLTGAQGGSPDCPTSTGPSPTSSYGPRRGAAWWSGRTARARRAGGRSPRRRRTLPRRPGAPPSPDAGTPRYLPSAGPGPNPEHLVVRPRRVQPGRRTAVGAKEAAILFPDSRVSRRVLDLFIGQGEFVGGEELVVWLARRVLDLILARMNRGVPADSDTFLPPVPVTRLLLSHSQLLQM